MAFNRISQRMVIIAATAILWGMAWSVESLFWGPGVPVWAGENSFGLRSDDPVVITGNSVPTLIGSDVNTIVGFIYHDGWTQIPVQIDERTMVDIAVPRNDRPRGYRIPVYADAGTLVGPDPDPVFDADDELVFMAGDSGGPAPPSAWQPGGTITGPGKGLRLIVTDPVSRAVAYVYLFLSDGTLSPDAGFDYVSYDFRLLGGSYPADYRFSNGPNPEESVVSTAHYRVHFTDRWIRDEFHVFAGGATGVDILDRHKFLFAPGECGRTEDTFSLGAGGFIANIDGPVRAIRSYLGANSGYGTQRDHHFYSRRHEVLTFLRVHPIRSATDLNDYSPEAAGMLYYNDGNPEGVVIDGRPDTVASHPIQWEMVTGEQGTVTIAHRVDSDIPNLTYTSFYSDDTVPTRIQCTGDAHEYGTSGPMIPQGLPNTDPLRGPAYALTWRRVEYVDAPDQDPRLAAQRARNAYQPCGVVVEPVN